MFRWVLFFLLFCAHPLIACPPPGTYEIYNAEGQKTGTIVARTIGNVADSSATIRIECTTTMDVSGIGRSYRFVETDTADIAPQGIVSFRRESDDNGVKTIFVGQRRDHDLIVNYEREGKKLSTAFPVRSFDLSDFEMDFVRSRFRALKPRQSAQLRVLSIDKMDVLPVTRNVSDIQEFPYNGRDVNVMVVTTVMQSQMVRSWFDVKTGKLLQEQGADYLLSRAEP